ncbi:restriction endonuclease subunit S [Macrococcoides goetzii]|uniref:Restriction endonuclease subunit S n=2 Tax=Macrococcoides goetzii TaxID=1891097 RepID=A0A364JKD2_9STAP|nr:restriction endonuclease subunit S [Macrococcus goetzii]
MGQSPKSEFYNDIAGTPFLQGNRTFGFMYPKFDTYTSKITKLAGKGDILFSVRAPVGDINIAPLELCIGRGLSAISSKNDNNEFLYYLLKNMKNIENFTSGTIFSSINKKTLENLEFYIPNNQTQRKIGKILRNIDEKIELNNKTIDNLEQISQTLFKHWFIDFEFPNEDGKPYKSSGGEMVESELGEIPKGWMIHSLSEYVDIKKGLSYKGEFLDKDKLLDESFPLISLSNFNFIKGFKDKKTKYYFGDYKQNHKIYPGDLIIAATDLTQDRKMLGAPALVPNLSDLMIYSLDVFKVIENNLPLYFLYFSLQTRNYRMIVEGNATGTTVLRISKDSLLSYKFPKSNNELEQLYHNTVVNIMNMISLLNEQSKFLEKLRDSLLPKLLSGEIEIPEDLEV